MVKGHANQGTKIPFVVHFQADKLKKTTRKCQTQQERRPAANVRLTRCSISRHGKGGPILPANCRSRKNVPRPKKQTWNQHNTPQRPASNAFTPDVAAPEKHNASLAVASNRSQRPLEQIVLKIGARTCVEKKQGMGLSTQSQSAPKICHIARVVL